MCSLAVCAVAWLVAHVRMLGLDEREKSLQMIRQLAGPLYSENTLQFYNERSVPPPPCQEGMRELPRCPSPSNMPSSSISSHSFCHPSRLEPYLALLRSGD